MMTGHTGAILELHFSRDGRFVLIHMHSLYNYTSPSLHPSLFTISRPPSLPSSLLPSLPPFSLPHSMIFTASTDKTGAVWDCSVGQRIKKLKGHTSFVNSCASSRRGVQVVATGSDDGTIKVLYIQLQINVWGDVTSHKTSLTHCLSSQGFYRYPKACLFMCT